MILSAMYVQVRQRKGIASGPSAEIRDRIILAGKVVKLSKVRIVADISKPLACESAFALSPLLLFLVIDTVTCGIQHPAPYTLAHGDEHVPKME